MDLRIQKTRQNIFQAFIELREKYPLEKITVKELTERAQISKQTFYLHYRDMYDLSERIEQSMIQEMLKELPYPEISLPIPVRSQSSCSRKRSIRGIISGLSFPALVSAHSPKDWKPPSKMHYTRNVQNTAPISAPIFLSRF